MNNLLQGLENVKLPTIKVAVDEDTWRNGFIMILLAGVSLMVINKILFK